MTLIVKVQHQKLRNQLPPDFHVVFQSAAPQRNLT
jgi:hypothetical protein